MKLKQVIPIAALLLGQSYTQFMDIGHASIFYGTPEQTQAYIKQWMANQNHQTIVQNTTSSTSTQEQASNSSLSSNATQSTSNATSAASNATSGFGSGSSGSASSSSSSQNLAFNVTQQQQSYIQSLMNQQQQLQQQSQQNMQTLNQTCNQQQEQNAEAQAQAALEQQYQQWLEYLKYQEQLKQYEQYQQECAANATNSNANQNGGGNQTTTSTSSNATSANVSSAFANVTAPEVIVVPILPPQLPPFMVPNITNTSSVVGNGSGSGNPFIQAGLPSASDMAYGYVQELLGDFNVTLDRVTPSNFYGWAMNTINGFLSGIANPATGANSLADLGNFVDCVFNLSLKEQPVTEGGNATSTNTTSEFANQISLNASISTNAASNSASSLSASSGSSQQIEGQNGFWYNGVWYSFGNAGTNTTSSSASSTPAFDPFPAYCTDANRAISRFVGGLASIPTVVTGLDTVIGWFSSKIQKHSNFTFDTFTQSHKTINDQLNVIEQQMTNNVDMIYYMQYEIYYLWEQEQAAMSGMNTTTVVSSVIDYIQKNGLQVSERWRLSEEDTTGYLYLRDVVASKGGVDARYRFRNGTFVNF